MLSGIWKSKLKDWRASNSINQILPEVVELKGINQTEEFHSEGDAFTHTLMAVDLVDSSTDERVFWAVLLHDVGKAATTKMVNGRWRAWGHEKVGANMVPGILHRFDLDHLSNDVSWLVKHHGFMLSWGEGLTVLTNKQKRFCSHQLFDLLISVATVDAKASLGNSTKLKMLHRILTLRDNN